MSDKHHSPFTLNWYPTETSRLRGIQILAASVILQAFNDATRELPACVDRHFTLRHKAAARSFLTAEAYRADREFWCHIVDVPEVHLRRFAVETLEGAHVGQ